MHTELEHGERLGDLLRALPAEGLRPYEWSEFRRRAHERAALGQRIAAGRRIAAAVVLAVAVCAGAIRWVESGPRPAAPRAAAPPAAAARRPPTAPRADEAYEERYLASLPHEPAVVRVGTRAAVATLEDHIALVDDLLSAQRVERAPPARLLALQHERSELISSLVQVRYAETLADESR